MPLPYSGDLDTNQLLHYHKQILFGLLDRHIKVVSYACDSTELNAPVQHSFWRFAEKTVEHVIKNPYDGSPDTKIVIGIFCGQAIVYDSGFEAWSQDFLDNLFSRRMSSHFGNYTAIYQRIEQLTFENGHHSYQRDVHKTDRQDDNAAACLFSASTLKFLSDKHPEYLSEIIYLFVFGE